MTEHIIVTHCPSALLEGVSNSWMWLFLSGLSSHFSSFNYSCFHAQVLSFQYYLLTSMQPFGSVSEKISHLGPSQNTPPAPPRIYS